MNGRPTWKGYTCNKIQWNEEIRRWELLDEVNSRILASMTGSEELPAGELVWSTETENICKTMDAGSDISLMLSKCEEFECSCADGPCVPIELKCNYVGDCFDRNDENECSTLIMEGMDNYDVGILDIVTNCKNHING